MLYDYDSELVNVLAEISEPNRVYSSRSDAFGLPIGPAIEAVRSGTILYFPPGRYLLPARDAPWVCEQGVQWFFADGAILRIDWGATLVIRGTIRAGSQQIFGFDRTRLPVVTVDGDMITLPPSVNTWPLESRGGVSAGRIIIESDDIPLVRPEWWGAKPWDGSTIQVASTAARDFDSSDAFQGAIEAACTGRAAIGKPPIPIVLLTLYQTTKTIEVRAPSASSGRLIPASLVWRGGAGVRGFQTVVRIRVEAQERAVPEVLLRLHPGVDFDFQDVSLSVRDNVEGCLDVLCDESDPVGRRGFLRRVTLEGGKEFRLRITESGRTSVRRQFVLDGCALVTLPEVASLNGVRLDAGSGVMLRVSDTGMGTATIPADVAWTPEAQNQSTCHLTGGSVLLDSLLFHQNQGPRPSRDPEELDQPDGQDIFLGAPTGTGREGTHLTVMQCESQSWWLLARDRSVASAHQAVVIGVGHENVNWADIGIPRAAAWGIPGVAATWPPDTSHQPPSIVWCGSAGQCVVIGSRLDECVLLSDPAAVVNVGTAFKRGALGASLLRVNFVTKPSDLTRRANGFRPGDSPMVTSVDRSIRRLVPILEDPPS